MFHVRTVAIAMLLISPALADDSVPIKGSVYLGEEGCPNGIKAPECLLTFQITGKVAKLLFDGMRVKAAKEECTGGFQKTDGNGLNCIKAEDGTYSCDFGYDFSKKSFGGGALDC